MYFFLLRFRYSFDYDVCTAHKLMRSKHAKYLYVKACMTKNCQSFTSPHMWKRNSLNKCSELIKCQPNIEIEAEKKTHFSFDCIIHVSYECWHVCSCQQISWVWGFSSFVSVAIRFVETAFYFSQSFLLLSYVEMKKVAIFFLLLNRIK